MQGVKKWMLDMVKSTWEEAKCTELDFFEEVVLRDYDARNRGATKHADYRDCGERTG